MGCLSDKTIEKADGEDKDIQKQCIVKINNPVLMPEAMTLKLAETIVRIEYKNKISTGFFMKINLKENQQNFLVTCDHCISQNDIDLQITVSLFYGNKTQESKKEIKLDNNKRFMKSFINLGFDAIIIEILSEDEIPEDKYLLPDMNYINGYDQYIKTEIYTAGYPSVDTYTGEKHFSAGMIKAVKSDKGKFIHDCPTKAGSSGSPLLNINQQVIGIHYGCNDKETVNLGVFIGRIIDILKKNENNIICKGNSINKIYVKKKRKVSNPNNIDYKETISMEDNNNDILKINKKQQKERININEKEDEKINEKEDEKINEKEDDKINEKEDPKKSEDNLLINALSKGEQKNKKFKPIKESDLALIGMVFNNPSFMNLIKTMYKNPLMAEYLNNTPEIKRLKEKNPIFKEVLRNPELMDKLFTPDLFNTFSQMASMINNNEEDKKEDIKINDKNDIMNQQNEINNLLDNINSRNGSNGNNNVLNPRLDKNNEKKESYLNLGNDINDILINNIQDDDSQIIRKKYQKELIQLKNLGFKNEKDMEFALDICEGNVDNAVQYLYDLEHVVENKK